MMKAIGKGIAVMGLVFLPALACGETAMTLAEAVQAALDRNDFIRAEAMKVKATESKEREARGGLLPKITFQERYLRTDNPAYTFSTKINQEGFTMSDLAGAPGSFNDPDPISDYETSLTVEQVLYSRRAWLGFEMARSESSAVELDVQRQRENLALRVHEAWLGALTAEAYVQAAEAAVQDAREHLRLAEVMIGAGMGLEADRLRAEVALGEAEMNLLRVRNNASIARLGLGLAVGIEEEVRPIGSAEHAEAPVLDNLLARLDTRSDLRAMEARVDNADRNVRMAEAEYLPDVGLFGAYQMNDPDAPLGSSGQSYRIGVGLTWNLMNGFSTTARRDEALAMKERVARLREGMKKEARYRVKEAWLRLQETIQGLELARKAETAAEEGVRLTRLRYENGLSTLATLLDMQASLDRARSNRVGAEMGVRTAEVQALHQSGTLLDRYAGRSGALARPKE